MIKSSIESEGFSPLLRTKGQNAASSLGKRQLVGALTFHSNACATLGSCTSMHIKRVLANKVL
jgi:hypothetical protein